MEQPRYTFEEAGSRGWNVYRFFDDRIEMEWREPFKKGMLELPSESVSGKTYEQTTFGFGARRHAISFAIYSLIGLVLLLGLGHPILQVVGWVSIASAVISLGFLISKLKSENWISVQRPDGSSLFGVRERGLKGTSRDELLSEIRKYRRIEQSTEHNTGDNA